MKKNIEKLNSIFDGLESVHGTIKDVPDLQERQFSPYDELTGTIETPFGYAGEMEDENGLVYLRARYYNRNTGTFLSMDPFEGNIDNPMSLNRYAYAFGNPVNNTDPSGKDVCSDLDPTAAQRGECFRKVFDLSGSFGIELTEEEALSPKTKEHWTSPRVNNVYAAVQAINRRLGGLTKQAIGGTELRLISQGSGSEAAVTTLCNVVSLFLNFPSASDHVHSIDNIIHEFGHVITLSPPVGRTANSEAIGPAKEMANRPVALWGQIQNYRSFSEQNGWNADFRQNHTDISAEVVADMFLYSVQGYPFPEDDQYIGQTRSAFMNGGDIPKSDGSPLSRINDNTAINDGSVIRGAGITTWAGNASCAGTAVASAGEPSPAKDPYVKVANAGWCSLTQI